MNTLKIEATLAAKYKYKQLEPELSEKYRQFFKDNIPEWLCENGSEIQIKTAKGTIVSYGYDRIVIGDYGAFIEFSENQSNNEAFVIAPGQEYRIND